MISSSIKKLFRRCLLIAVFSLATVTANAQQMPTSKNLEQLSEQLEKLPPPQIPMLESISVQTLDSASDKDSVLETTDGDLKLADYISEKFEVSVKVALEIIKLAAKHANEDFPKRNDILALIAVESRYKTKALFKGCFGLMQINKKAHSKSLKGRNAFNPDVNIEVGSSALHDYYSSLGSSKAAVISFNVGIGTYLKRKYKQDYYKKYLSELKSISAL